MIPKIIHQIWLGDQSRRPRAGMATWAAMNPGWEYRLWTEDDFAGLTNQAHFDAYHSFPGRADILRYEILRELGGFYIDADTECIRPLDDDLLEPAAFTCWENEQQRPGLMANGFLAGVPGHRLFTDLINRINEIDPRHMDYVPPWILTGPLLLTTLARHMPGVVVYPSHYFLPEHFSGVRHAGEGRIYCNHFWGSTRDPGPEPT